MNQRLIAIIFLVLLGLGLAGAFALGAFDDSDQTPSMAGKGDTPKKTTADSPKPDAEPKKNVEPKVEPKDQPKPIVSEGDPKPVEPKPVEPKPLPAAKQISKSFDISLYFESGLIPAESLSLKIADKLGNAATISSSGELAPSGASMAFIQTTITYDGPETEGFALPLTISSTERPDIQGILPISFTEPAEKAHIELRWGVTVSGAIYQQGGRKPYADAKARITDQSWGGGGRTTYYESSDGQEVRKIESSPARPVERRSPDSKSADQDKGLNLIMSEAGMRREATIECEADGTFTAKLMTPGSIMVEALYPDGTSFQDVKNGIQWSYDSEEDWGSEPSTPSETPVDPRTTGEYASEWRDYANSGGEIDDIWLGLSPTSVLRFTMTNPVQGPVSVTFFNTDMDANGGMFRFSNRNDGERSFEVGEGGKVTVPGLIAEVKRVRLHPKGYLPLEKIIKVRAGEDLDLGRITFEAGLTLRGRVLDAEGNGVAGVGISTGDQSQGAFAFMGIIEGNRSAAVVATSGEDGSYEINGLEAGNLFVRVVHEQYRAKPFKLVLKAGQGVVTQDIVVGIGGTIEGTILVTPAMREIIKQAKSRGFGEITRAVPESPDDGKTEEKKKAPEEDNSLFGQGRVASVALLNMESFVDSSIPFFGADETAMRTLKQVQSKPDGSFLIPQVAAGEYEVIADIKGIKTKLTSITVGDGGVAKVTLEFPKPARVFGRITLADGTPLSEQSVYLQSRMMGGKWGSPTVKTASRFITRSLHGFQGRLATTATPA